MDGLVRSSLEGRHPAGDAGWDDDGGSTRIDEARSEMCVEEEGVQLTWYQRLPVVWIIGLIIFAIGNVMDFMALAIAPQSVVTLVGSWALCVNAFAAR